MKDETFDQIMQKKMAAFAESCLNPKEKEQPKTPDPEPETINKK
ncbi:hypothetical protein ACFL2O_10785 [Thermodesulfobacteriota bacterium]